MSRKHFKSLADAVKRASIHGDMTQEQHVLLAREISSACLEHNVRFNRNTFYKACGLEYRVELGWVRQGS